MPRDNNEFKSRFSASIPHICLHKFHDPAQPTVWASPFHELKIYTYTQMPSK